MATTIPCEKCGSHSSKVVDTRTHGGTVRRRRVCKGCGHRYATLEASESQSLFGRWPLGSRVQTKRRMGTNWRGSVVGHWRRVCVGHTISGAVVENGDGAVMAFRDDCLTDWDGVRHNAQLEWTPDMLATLREMRSRGECYQACSDRIGASYGQIAAKCHELGINRKMNRGPIAAREVKAKEEACE